MNVIDRVPFYEESLYNRAKLNELASKVYSKFCDIRIINGADYLVVTGLSGTILSSLLFSLYDIPTIHVRKTDETCHGKRVQGYIKENAKFVILDDLISSGTTMKNILWNIRELNLGLKCSGIILYCETEHDKEFKWEGLTIPIFPL